MRFEDEASGLNGSMDPRDREAERLGEQPEIYQVYIASIRDHSDITIVNHRLASQKAILRAALHGLIGMMVGFLLIIIIVALKPDSAEPVNSVLEKLLPLIEPHQLLCALLVCVILGVVLGHARSRL